jgi:hypothetical protein
MFVFVLYEERSHCAVTLRSVGNKSPSRAYTGESFVCSYIQSHCSFVHTLHWITLHYITLHYITCVQIIGAFSDSNTMHSKIVFQILTSVHSVFSSKFASDYRILHRTHIVSGLQRCCYSQSGKQYNFRPRFSEFSNRAEGIVYTDIFHSYCVEFNFLE